MTLLKTIEMEINHI